MRKDNFLRYFLLQSEQVRLLLASVLLLLPIDGTRRLMSRNSGV